MDLEVVGRHALLFDDDAAATFVNSGDALVDWNSLLIDRYDVRHLLSAPPPPRNRRTHTPPDGFSADAEIEHERYLDLQAAIEKEEADVDAKSVEASGYHSVAFSYGNPVDTNDQNNYGDEMGDSSFQPPFYVPENLLQCLPPTEKVHQIIARTALFVAKNGSQSEIVLRVKQGDNPTFGFLMPDHHLHPYFRYLIDNQDLWKSDSVEKSENKKKETSAALSLLGSVYGSGDDEDVATDNVSKSNENETRNIPHATISSVGHGFQETKLLPEVNDKKEEVLKQANSQKEDTQVSNKNPVMKVSKAGIPNSKRKEGHLSLPSTTLSKPSFSASVNASKVEPVIIEPPSDIKRLVDKVVEFILKNGPQFETVLTEQDSRNGRFPFLLHSNQFHPYYANVLQKAQEAKSSGKSSRLDEKLSLGKESDSLSSGQASGDIPYDYDRKEKFKMVLGKTKNDSDDPSTKNATSSSRITINAAQAAAILRAGTRGVNNSNVGIIPNLSLNGEIKEPSVSIAANEANSNEDHMTKEQKLKAERLKRAKMFVSMLKSGAAPSKSETPRGLSVEPQEAVVSGVERESSVTLDIKTSVREDESERKLFTNEIHERMSKRKYRSKSSRYEEDETIEENEDGDGEKGKEKNEKHSKKKHRSHKSLRESDKEIEDDVGREYRDSKRKHQSHRSSRKNGTEEDDDDTEGSVAYKHDKKRHRSRRSSHKNGTDEEEGDEEDRDYRHDKRKHRSREKSRKGKELKYDEEDREYRDEKRKLRTHRSSRENGTDEEDGDDDRDYRHGKRKHQSHHEKRKELEDDEEDNEYRDEKRKLKTHRSSCENGTEEEDDEDRDYRHGKRKHRSHGEKSKESEDEEDREHGDYKRKLRSHRSLRENDSEEEDDGEEGRDRDYRHGKRKHRSHRSSHENGKEVEDDEEDRNYRRSKRKRRSRHSLHENNIEEEDDDEDWDHKHGKNKHRSRSTSRQDENDDDKRGHKKSSKKHRSYYSSDEDEENDYPEKSKKKHKSHRSSRRKRIRHKHKEHDSSSEDTKSLNLKMHEKWPSHQGQPDLEEGEISSKNSDESRRNVRAGARREVSIDVSSSYQEREPSQTVEATQVPDDLRAKIRAMLMENL